MPRVNDRPAGLRPYLFHGINLESRGGREALGDCPFCGREGKFSVNSVTGQWRCFVCNEGKDTGKVVAGGNARTFLKLLHAGSVCQDADGGVSALSELAADRRLYDPGTLAAWSVARSFLTDEYLVPGYNVKGELTQLYRYAENPGDGRKYLLLTPSLDPEDAASASHALHGVNLYEPARPTVYLCEGPWDGMALWEALKSFKRATAGDNRNGAGGLIPTGSESASLLANANVLAVPGCGVFQEAWLPLFAGKDVVLMYDSDRPRVHPRTQLPVAPAGYSAMQRVAAVMSCAESPPNSIHFVRWGPDGYDPDLADGWDVRDSLTLGPEPEGGRGQDTARERAERLEALLSRVEPIPEAWLGGRTPDAVAKGSPRLAVLPCDSWEEVQRAWRKALKWTDGLDRGLSFCLSVIISTKSVGDPIWGKVVGPPSCGKSVLCEALSVADKYVTPKSTIRGFHSGYKSDRDGKEDNSLIPQIKDKTLVTKDGDTLLQAPNLNQILAEARDLYDKTSRTHYRNKAGRSYEGVNMTWILCGTSSLRKLDSSELGERFLDCVIVDDMGEEMERAIGWRVALRAAREVTLIADGLPETREGPEMILAKRLTGGYVNHLRENAQRLLDAVEVPESVLVRCQYLAEFVSFMRSRPSGTQDEEAHREMSFRLISQHVRLAVCTAAVLGKTLADDEVMRRVTRVAVDTARGRTLNLAKHLYDCGHDGTEGGTLAFLTSESEEKTRNLLNFLRKIKVVELFRFKLGPGYSGPNRWRLTPRLRNLYEEVIGETDPTLGYGATPGGIIEQERTE